MRQLLLGAEAGSPRMQEIVPDELAFVGCKMGWIGIQKRGILFSRAPRKDGRIETMKKPEGKLIMNASAMRRALKRMASEIVDRNDDLEAVGLVGIRTRGEPMAERLQCYLSELEKVEVPVGVLDITLYRDDVGLSYPNPVVGPTLIDFQVTGKVIVLVDDVLFTGRTVRAALDAIMDFGRPAAIQLAVLIDRGLRELPIVADYAGKKIETTRSQRVEVSLQETDGTDSVFLLEDPQEDK